MITEDSTMGDLLNIISPIVMDIENWEMGKMEWLEISDEEDFVCQVYLSIGNANSPKIVIIISYSGRWYLCSRMIDGDVMSWLVNEEDLTKNMVNDIVSHNKDFQTKFIEMVKVVNL